MASETDVKLSHRYTSESSTKARSVLKLRHEREYLRMMKKAMEVTSEASTEKNINKDIMKSVELENIAYGFALLGLTGKMWTTKEWLPLDFVCQTAAMVQGVLYCGGYFPAERNTSVPKTVMYRVGLDHSLEEVEIPPLLDKKRHCFTLVNLGNSLCCVGGEHEPLQNHNCSKNVYRLVDGCWVPLPDMNHARKLPGAVSVGDYLIVAGGMGDDCYPELSIEILDIFHPTKWLKAGILPEGAVYPQLLVISDQLIAGADRDLTGVSKKYYSRKVYSRPLYELHQAASKAVAVRGGPEVRGWSEFPLLPKSGSALTNFNGQLLSFGGHNPTSIFGTCKQAYILNEGEEWISAGEVRSYPCTGLFAFSGPNEEGFQVVGVLDTRRPAFYFGPCWYAVKKLMSWFCCLTKPFLYVFVWLFLASIFSALLSYLRYGIISRNDKEALHLLALLAFYGIFFAFLVIYGRHLVLTNRVSYKKPESCKNRRSIDVCQFLN